MKYINLLFITLLIFSCNKKEDSKLNTSSKKTKAASISALKKSVSYNKIVLNPMLFSDTLTIQKQHSQVGKLISHNIEAGQFFFVFANEKEQIAIYPNYQPLFLPLSRLYDHDLKIHFINDQIFSIEILNSPFPDNFAEGTTIIDSIKHDFNSKNTPQKSLLPSKLWTYIQCKIIKGQCAQAQEVKPTSNGQWEKVLPDPLGEGEPMQEEF